MLINHFQVCDADMQILSVDASHGGATHDSFIWASHPLKAHLEELSNRENIWFLGVYNFIILLFYKIFGKIKCYMTELVGNSYLRTYNRIFTMYFECFVFVFVSL